MTNNLLDLICEKSGCAYVSDLTQKKHHNAIAKAAIELMEQSFDADEWIAACEYVSLGQVKAKTSQKAKEYFQELNDT